MKSLKPLLSMMVYLILFGCTNEEINAVDIMQDVKEKNDPTDNQLNYPILSDKELIIEYPHDYPEYQKQILRNDHRIISYETCDCSDKQIEKWVFQNGINIEEEEEQITATGIGVENEFYYQNTHTTPDSLHVTNTEQSDLLIASNIVPNYTSITIAVLDTGIDLNLLPNTGPFLFRRRPNPPRCMENGEQEISGWDFVNHDNNPHDDNGHGTIVSGIIKSNLHDQKITDYEILPVKVFNHEGEGSYFDLLCGYRYAASKPSVSIINMSFGWYHKNGRLLKKYISQNNDILHITSAGNDYNDNDKVRHNPSSYNRQNIAAIGSINATRTEIADFSNYGETSVDFLSLGDMITFIDNNGVNYVASGTSYAAPFVTTKSAIQYLNGITDPVDILNQLRINATELSPGIFLPVRCRRKIID